MAPQYVGAFANVKCEGLFHRNVTTKLRTIIYMIHNKLFCSGHKPIA